MCPSSGAIARTVGCAAQSNANRSHACIACLAGNPPGFLKGLDAKRLAYADFRGNQRYLSVGNVQADDRITLFLMGYPNKRRLKILGTGELIDIEDDPGLIASLHDPDYPAVVERAFVITLAGFDWNCPQHIPQRYTVEELRALELQQ